MKNRKQGCQGCTKDSAAEWTACGYCTTFYCPKATAALDKALEANLVLVAADGTTAPVKLGA